MNIKLGSMSFEVSRHVEIKGYAYRQVELKNYIGRFNNRIGSDTFASDDAEISALHNLLCETSSGLKGVTKSGIFKGFILWK